MDFYKNVYTFRQLGEKPKKSNPTFTNREMYSQHCDSNSHYRFVMLSMNPAVSDREINQYWKEACMFRTPSVGATGVPSLDHGDQSTLRGNLKQKTGNSTCSHPMKTTPHQSSVVRSIKRA